MKIKEAAITWNVSERRVNELCRTGRISGAYKEGRQWYIPDDSSKPSDGRMNSKTAEQETVAGNKALPVGISDYKEACKNYYYVDKTLLIKEFLDERPKVSLFTRPRRFGKTLNMDMLRVFFEKTKEDTSVYFHDKKIWQCGNRYISHQGKYPVVFLSFKDVKYTSWDETYAALRKLIAMEFRRHGELEKSDMLNSFEQNEFIRLANENGNEVDYQMSLQTLTLLLHKHYGTAPIVIIDEYDTPVQQGYMKNFYDKVIGFMRNLFSGGLKDNSHLSYGLLTGILRVAQESIFSGLNNLKINSILDERYSEYFGFTADEIREMAGYYGAAEKYREICDWYDGYRFGNTDIFNPWSVIGYFNNYCRPKTFWQSTGSNDVIQEILDHATPDIMEQLTLLVSGQSVTTHIDTGVIYPQLNNNPTSIYSFLLVAGYLKTVNYDQPYGEEYICEVALPNKEVALVYRKEILQKLNNIIPQSLAVTVEKAIFTCDAEKLKDVIGKLLIHSVSAFDTAGENFYHGFMLGICALFGNFYVTSNRESGMGRYDICLDPKEENLPGVIIELKAEKNCDSDRLKALAEAAVNQIEEKRYDADMKEKGVAPVYKFGVAFSGKNVEVKTG